MNHTQCVVTNKYFIIVMKNCHCCLLFQLHMDWVTKVRYWGNIHFALSCSNDSQKSLHLLDLTRNRGSVIRLRKGVNTFDFCSEWGIIGKQTLIFASVFNFTINM